MTSIGARTRQVSTDSGNYINLGDLTGSIVALTATNPPVFGASPWANSAVPAIQSTLRVVGAAVLKDMGKTVVSASRTFRKIQLVVSTTSTFGVGGPVGNTADYYTGYIELCLEGYGVPAKVAQFGR